jgi:hypothetical protein
MKPYPELP